MPVVWCRGAVAHIWLVAEGWEIRGDRAYKKGMMDIPAPKVGQLYDLHDVACEEGVGGSEIIRRIHKWVAGHSEDRRHLHCESCKERATVKRPVILWWLVAHVNPKPKPVVVRMRLQHDEPRCCNMPEDSPLAFDTAALTTPSDLRARVTDIMEMYELSPSDAQWLREVAGL